MEEKLIILRHSLPWLYIQYQKTYLRFLKIYIFFFEPRAPWGSIYRCAGTCPYRTRNPNGYDRCIYHVLKILY